MLCSRDVGASIISNGRLLTEPVLLELLECGADLFELPLLSYRREVHDDLSGSQGAFDAVLAAMAQLGTLGGTFVATFVLTQLNCTDLRDTIKLAYAFGAHGLMLNRFNPGGRGIKHIKMLLPTAGQVQEALSIAEATSVELGFPISCSIPIQPCLLEGVSDKTDNQRLFPHLNFGFCAVGTDRAYYTLDSLGNLRPCNHTPTILGNLFDESFSDLIAPERLRFFTRSIPSFCDGCILREICQGGCKAAAQVCYGSLTAEEPFLHNNKGKGVGDEG
jgi:radical SAM protein with 4Fe4S-binding SPASM domain